MDYQNFTIDVRSAGRGRFEARVVDSPYRISPRVPFQRPIPKRMLKALQAVLDKQASPGSKAKVKLVAEPWTFGCAVYNAIFRNGLAELFTECRATLSGTPHSGLRIRLRFDLSDLEIEYLEALPWELLCTSADRFLATDPSTPVVRDLLTGQPYGSLAVEPPLRILVVDAAPRTMHELNLKLEIERMREALQPLVDQRLVMLERLLEPTPEALHDALMDSGFHILHFMGHGGYNADYLMGAVFFAKPDGEEETVLGQRFADCLQGLPDLRLVVLNSCKTARHANHGRTRFSYGVASAILDRTRVPAVVANQYAISDEAAIAFSGTFYARLAAGDEVDTALTAARLRLRHRSREWATPVLFLGARDGKLFTLEPGKPRHTDSVLRSKADPVRLGVRSRRGGWGRDMEERNEVVLDLTAHFDERDDRYIKHQKDWQEKVLPELQAFLLKHVDEGRPLELDFAAHSSIAFAAGWLLEAKSGLDVSVLQRTQGESMLDWHPRVGEVPDGLLWLDEPDLDLSAEASDVAVALAVSQPRVADHVQEYVRRKSLDVSRILHATIAPEPGQRSVQSGAHALRLAQAVLARVRQRRPNERRGRVHMFCAAPNALVFYLGQLSRSLGRILLYEYPFGAQDSFGKYQPSIELGVREPELGPEW
jgi:hypothetical protein